MGENIEATKGIKEKEDMKGTEKLDELQFNELVETDKLLPSMKQFMGEHMKFVGKTYIFVGDTGLLQEIKLHATGFNLEDYEHE
jgi:hypothetical protein